MTSSILVPFSAACDRLHGAKPSSFHWEPQTGQDRTWKTADRTANRINRPIPVATHRGGTALRYGLQGSSLKRTNSVAGDAISRNGKMS